MADDTVQTSPDVDRPAMLAEAYKRGILPPDVKSAYEESLRRGLVATTPAVLDVYRKSTKSPLPENMKPPISGMERFETGLADPFYGAAQLGAHVMPGGAGKKTDTAIQQREQNYRAQRSESGQDPDSMDWYRTAGQTVPTLPLAVLNPALAGGIVGAVQPVTEGDYGTEKLKQVALGGVSGGLGAVGGKVASRGVTALGGYLAREFPENVRDRAVQVVLGRIDQDAKYGGPTVQHVMDALNTARASQKPLTLADLGGENIKQLGGYVARQPGESRNFARSVLMGRDADAGARLNSDVSRYISSGPTMQQTAEALTEARSNAAAPLYEEAFSANQSVSSKLLDRILNTDAGKAALEGARQRMSNRMSLMGKPDPELAEQAREAGQILKGGVASGLKLKTWDLIKQDLDDTINSTKRKVINGTARKGELGELIDLKRAMVRELDNQDITARAGPNSMKPEGGAYARARAAYSGPSQSLDALEAGKEIFKQTPEEISAAFAKLNPNDQEFYRTGVADVLRERIAKTGVGGNEARALIKNDWTRNQLKPIFPTDEAFNNFADAVGAEHTMADTTTRMLRGSQTAERLAEDQSPDNRAVASGSRLAKDLVTGNWLSALANGARLKKDLGLRSDPALNEAVGHLLFTPNLSKTGEAGARLLGNFPGPITRNYLRAPAQTINRMAQFAAPAVATVANQLIGP